VTPKNRTLPINPQTFTTPDLWPAAGDDAPCPQKREKEIDQAEAALCAAQRSKRCIMPASTLKLNQLLK
jgi:hypothetical protein